jgi:hypothetical protein
VSITGSPASYRCDRSTKQRLLLKENVDRRWLAGLCVAGGVALLAR